MITRTITARSHGGNALLAHHAAHAYACELHADLGGKAVSLWRFKDTGTFCVRSVPDWDAPEGWRRIALYASNLRRDVLGLIAAAAQRKFEPSA